MSKSAYRINLITGETEQLIDIDKDKKKKKKKKWYDGYIDVGAFKDGYQFGDLSKTVSATTTDVSRNFTEGIVGMGEKIVDTGAGLIGNAAGLVGADGTKEKMTNFVKKVTKKVDKKGVND